LSTQAHSQPALEPQALPAGRAGITIWLAVLVLVSYAGYFSRLGALGLVGPDEPRYVSIARAMERTGDWITPRLNGSPWFEKPALYYWAAGLSFKMIGENDFAARLPSALAACLAAIAMAWAAARFYGRSTMLSVLLLSPSSIGMMAFARAATPDMLFTGTLAATAAFGAALLFSEKSRIWPAVGFGLFLGAATLAKGPAAVVLAGGSALLWALFTRKWSRAFRLAHPVAILMFLLTAVPWYYLCAKRNPDFLAIFLLLHNVNRYLTPVFHHPEPFWFFLAIIILTILPWAALLFGIGQDATSLRGENGWLSSPSFYFACWTIFTLLFFSISKSKLPAYILPGVPPLLLLLARAAVVIRVRRDDTTRGVTMGLGFTWVALAATAFFWLHRQPTNSAFGRPPAPAAWIFICALGGIAIAIVGYNKRVFAAVVINATLIAGFLLAANWFLLPRLDHNLSARATAQTYLASLSAGANPNSSPAPLRAYRLNRNWQYGLEYYLAEPLSEWSPGKTTASVLLFTPGAACEQLARSGFICDPLQEVSDAAWLVEVRYP
jgi:4-amino-4-deoxy-L-arabinose transferase-like glycosyltransferase